MMGWASAPSHTAPSHAHCRALFAFKAGQAAGIGRRQRPGRLRHGGCGTKAKRQAVEESGSVVDGGPLDILARDLQFLHDRTGVDLITPLTPVKDAHDQVLPVGRPQLLHVLENCAYESSFTLSRWWLCSTPLPAKSWRGAWRMTLLAYSWSLRPHTERLALSNILYSSLKYMHLSS